MAWALRGWGVPRKLLMLLLHMCERLRMCAPPANHAVGRAVAAWGLLWGVLLCGTLLLFRGLGLRLFGSLLLLRALLWFGVLLLLRGMLHRSPLHGRKKLRGTLLHGRLLHGSLLYGRLLHGRLLHGCSVLPASWRCCCVLKVLKLLLLRLL